MWILRKFFNNSTPVYDGDLWTYGVWNSIWNTHDSLDSLSHDALLRLYKGWVFASCDAIWDGMMMLDTALYKSKKRQDKVKEHELKELITPDLVKGTSVFLKTLWAAYLYKEQAGGKVIGLKLLKTQNVVENKDAYNNTQSYWYSDGARVWDFELDDIIKIETFTPIVSDTWMTPLKAVANQVAMDLASVEFNKLFFENGWRPWTVLMSDKKINADIRDEYLSKWKANFVGLKNAHKVAFLDQDIKVQDFSSTQKDMDLSAQRTFTMDEVLMTFRVSKPILGKSDGVWFADRKVPWYYFNEYTLKPLAKSIADALNDQLFKWVWYFAFLFPQDKDELRQEWISGLITHNQYLVATGRPLIENGNVLYSGEEVEFQWEKVAEGPRRRGLQMESSIEAAVKSVFNTKKFGSEEYNQKYWETKITRTDVEEKRMERIQRKIFNAQEKEIFKNLAKTGKDIKTVEKKDDLFDSKTSTLTYLALYTPFFTKMMNIEWQVAMAEVSTEDFAIDALNQWIGENIERMAKDIDDVTKTEIFDIIKEWNKEGIGADAIALNIRSKFNQYTKTRVDKIARTEVTRASNKSQDEAYVQSGVVSEKEWFTALDERVAPECQILHWTRVQLWKPFLKKGQKDELGNKVTYETIEFPPRHVNCRCTLRPIVSWKVAEQVGAIMKRKGIKFNINK